MTGGKDGFRQVAHEWVAKVIVPVVPSSFRQAEVQAVFSDGAVSLHTRSLKYGKVSQALRLQAQ